jgi:P27 family predicted phage terminase small subunit
MGTKGGPKKKPTALKKLNGTLRKSRVLTDEVQPDLIELYPEPPDILNEEARDEWRLVMPQLVELNIIAKVDMAMFTAYCIECGTYIHAQRVLNEEGMITSAANGTLMQHPMNNIKNAALKNALKIATEFGFTPSSRTSIGAPKKEVKDPLEELMKQAAGQ